MIAARAWRHTEGWLVAGFVVAAVGLCWRPSWWWIAAFTLAAAAVLREWRRSSQQLRLALGEGRRLAQRIHEVANLQGRFVGNIAHEIKTPLSVVLAETGVLLLHADDATAVRGHAKSMATEVRHLGDLIESFLRLARPFVHEDTAAHVPVFVGDVVISAQARCRELSRRLCIPIVTVLSEPDNGDPSAEVMGDPLLLETMVENLLRNALRFSPRGTAVGLTTRADADAVGILVRDHGIGIAPEHMESVFDWFFEGPARTAKTQGTGFGLAIARRVVDHHGGAIVLRNAPDGGCEFDVTLPRVWSTDPSVRTPATLRSDPPVAPTT